MRDALDVHVERAIVHILNHRQQKLVFSEADLPLQSEPEFQKYLDDQVKNALGDSETRAARFVPEGDGTTASLCYATLRNKEQLLDSSQQLAQRLFHAMGTDGRITPGSLIVCLYTATNYRARSFLALIKIDPSDALVQKIEKDRRGRRIVGFDIRTDVMPTAREKLQKAALIQPKRKENDYDLLLLDRQVAKAAANFFAKDFLNAAPVLDACARTERFYIGAQIAYNRLAQPPREGQPVLTPEQADVLLEQIEAALKAKTLDVDTWPANLDLPDEAKRVIAEEIERRLPTDRQFNIDAEYAQKKLVNKYRFRGDYGVLIEVEADHYKTVVTSRKDIERPDKTVVTQLTLEVPNLRWVKR
jgi:hypothetical protein